MKRIVVALAVFFVAQSVFAATNGFTRSLKLGMRGVDVRELQVFLNKDPETRVAETGVGSLGNETEYFGPATKRAVARFQEKYRDEVLVPAGLANGNGFFGEKTRAKVVALNTQTQEKPDIAAVTTPPAPVTPTAAANTEPVEVFIMSLSKYSGKPGTSIAIGGGGFTTLGNTIYFGETHAVERASSLDGQTISFRIPNIPKGLYSLSIKNTNGESDKEAFFVVTDGVTPEPKIESVELSPGNMVTIKGSGFLSEWNMVRAGVSVHRGVPSPDGKTLVFPLATAFSSTDSLKPTIFVAQPKDLKQFSIPVWVYVANNDGVSNATSFTLAL